MSAVDQIAKTLWSVAGPIIVLAAIALAFVLYKIWRQLQGGSETVSDDWPFVVRKPLSNAEQVLYFRLVEALPECIVLAQVALSRVIEVSRSGQNYRSWLNRIDRKTLDFVVCLKDATVVAAIELDDASHDRDDRRGADDAKSRALDAAGVKLIRWRAAKLPSVDEVRAAFTQQLMPSA